MRWRTVLIGLVVLLAAGAGGVYYLGGAHLRAAQAAINRHDLELARAELQKCLRLWPRSYQGHLLAAMSARRSYDYQDAQQHLDACEKLGEKTEAATLEAVLLDVQQGRISGAEKRLQELVAANSPDAFLIMEALATGYIKEYQLAKAQQTLDDLARRQPDNQQVFLLRGTLSELLTRDEDALRDYERALELKPESDEARLRVADELRQLGRIREATAQYQCLRKRRPEHALVILGLVRCLLDSAEVVEAQKLLDKLLADEPDNVRGLVERGRIAIRQAELDDAEAWLRKAAQLAPLERDAQQMLYVCLDAAHKREEAEQVLRIVKRLETDTSRVNSLMAKTLQSPRTPSGGTEIGILLLGLGRDEEGVRWLMSALQDNPADAAARAALNTYMHSRNGSGTEPGKDILDDRVRIRDTNPKR